MEELCEFEFELDRSWSWVLCLPAAAFTGSIRFGSLHRQAASSVLRFGIAIAGTAQCTRTAYPILY